MNLHFTHHNFNPTKGTVSLITKTRDNDDINRAMCRLSETFPFSKFLSVYYIPEVENITFATIHYEGEIIASSEINVINSLPNRYRLVKHYAEVLDLYEELEAETYQNLPCNSNIAYHYMGEAKMYLVTWFNEWEAEGCPVNDEEDTDANT